MKKLIVLGVLFLAPVSVAFAQLTNIESIVESLSGIIALLIPIAAALALLYFFWGLARFILAAGDPEARAQGRQIMIWGVVALFIIASVWGIIQFLGEALDVGQGGSIQVPTIGY